MPFGRDTGLSGGETCWRQCPKSEDCLPSMASGTLKGQLETVLSSKSFQCPPSHAANSEGSFMDASFFLDHDDPDPSPPHL